MDVLDLPHPLRSALVFGGLAAAALALDADPRLPWAAGVVAGALFAVAGSVRGFRAHRDLVAVRAAADRLIVHEPRTRNASALVRWRSEELTRRSHRDALAAEVGRLLRSLDPARLPSSSPLHRGAARAERDLLELLASRLADERPVSARGILLAQSLLREPASPLYADRAELLLRRSLRRVLGALEP
jgi:hypothetical protein